MDALIFPQSLAPMPDLAGTQRIRATTVDEINMLGTPGVTVPAGYYEDGSPFSLIFLGQNFSEAALLSYAYDYELATLHRKAPVLLEKGDYNGDGRFDVEDIDLLRLSILRPSADVVYDLDGDGQDSYDVVLWVTAIANSYIGDVNLDGEFNSGDLVVVFQAGEYEDAFDRNSMWATGD